MQTRRDQTQAHSFVVGRLVSAMLRAEPDAPFTPHRRFVIGWICGLVVGVLVLVACGIFGYIVPGGSNSWREPGVLVVEKETGNRYVYLDEQLRPVANYTSARLLLGGEPAVVRVSRRSLDGVAHGLPIGIESAPEALPNVDRLDGAHWLACSSLRPDKSGGTQPFVTLWVGAAAVGEPLGADRGLVVRTPSGELYLAWDNRRLRIPSASVLNALGYAAAPQQPVGWAWVNVVPPGPDLTAPDVPGRGQPGPVLDGQASTVGQLFQLSQQPAGGTGEQHYVMRTDGLSPVSMTGLTLLFIDPRTRDAYPTGRVALRSLTPDALAEAPLSRDRTVDPLHPAIPPKVAEVGAGEVPCLQVALDQGKGPQVSVAVGTPPTVEDAPPVLATRTRRLADRVVVEPGAGLLIQHQPAPGVADGALHLLVDTGVRYPLASAEVADVLGYGDVAPVPVPAALLDLIPVGRSLDPVAARATIPAAGAAAIEAREVGTSG